MDTQRWLDFLAEEIAAFRGIKVEEFIRLLPGQLLLWSRQWFEESGLGELSHSPLVCVTVRPRLSQHGGPRRGAGSGG